MTDTEYDLSNIDAMYDVDALRTFADEIGGSLIMRDNGQTPCVIKNNDKRQVVKVKSYPGFDCWVRRKHPVTIMGIVDDCHLFAANVKKKAAARFLDGRGVAQ